VGKKGEAQILFYEENHSLTLYASDKRASPPQASRPQVVTEWGDLI
jgi:hypothetical protein